MRLSLICDEGSLLVLSALGAWASCSLSVLHSCFGVSVTPRSLAAVSQASTWVTITKSEGEGNVRQRSKRRVIYQCGIFLFVHSSHRECDIPRGSVMDSLSHTVE